MFNTNELSAKWEENFYEGEWEPDTLNFTEGELSILKELKSFLPRHMPAYDWNLPYAEEIILIFRRQAAQQGRASDAAIASENPK